MLLPADKVWFYTKARNVWAGELLFSLIKRNFSIINGLSVGNTLVSVCYTNQGIHCLNVNVAVTGSVLGAITYFNAHPVGSWVIQGQTVYFVSASGLIPISTWQIFLSNGGQASLI